MKEFKYFVNLNCPNCGASMELEPGYAWVCPHCETKFYVMPAKRIETIAGQYKVDTRHVPEEMIPEYEKHIDHEAALKFGEYLLDHGFITKTKGKDPCLDCDINKYILRVVNPKEE